MNVTDKIHEGVESVKNLSTPGSIPVAVTVFASVGSGILGYFISRKLFKQSHMSAVAQGYTFAASTFGLLNAQSAKHSMVDLSHAPLHQTFS